MATKTISISEDAYNILKSKKETNESFSDIIIKLLGKKKLSSFYGILSDKSAKDFEYNIKESRKRHNKKHVERIKK